MAQETGSQLGWFWWSSIVDVIEDALSDVVR